MAFVFEVVRHGARNTYDTDEDWYTQGFSVPVEQLTPTGMRQRYLLGKHAREKYTEQYDLFSPDFVEGEVYVQSTDVNRTMQSGYSELMGIYPPEKAQARQLSSGELKAIQSGRGMPKMKIKNADTLNEELGANALPNGFVSVPIYTFVDKSVYDDVSYSGCGYA